MIWRLNNMVRAIKKLQLGKQGLTDAFILQVESLFVNETMIKIDVLKSACRDKKELKEIAETLVERLGVHFGYKIVGYVLTVTKFRRKQR